MRLSNFQWPVMKPYEKGTLEIYFQGCKRNTCTGDCHNPALRDFNGGEEWSNDEILSYIEDRKDLTDCISFTGGEPLHQDLEDLYLLVLDIKNTYPNKELWFFTGADNFDDIPNWIKIYFDVIKFGSYKKELAQEGFPASSNQKLYRKGRDY